ncbi:hypothetical protein NW762_004568 [Fusarium torreyae]|uniref:Uncharacterized protein n=1 Tax=Fusarium torreyae TaxID=1237075 RepID=A0A9W8S6W9_9HYPO|nr:hypothetical protein NW762_004568 [Fusarium torreyae]
MSSKVVRDETPVSTELASNAQELEPRSVNDLQEYRACETVIPQRFKDTWDQTRQASDWQYHDERNRLIKWPEGDHRREAALIKLEKKYLEKGAKHSDKKAAAWVPVLQSLKDKKSHIIQRIISTGKNAEKYEADYRIPEAGHWISFPVWNTNNDLSDNFNGTPVPITWTSSNTTFTATYYKITCWFGNMVFDQVPAEAPPTGPEENPTRESAQKPLPPKRLDQTAKKPQGDKPRSRTSNRREVRISDKKLARNTSAKANKNGENTASPVKKWQASARLLPFGSYFRMLPIRVQLTRTSGETDLFIAAEFIERRYQGAPHLRGLHLKDKCAPDTKWTHMLIDQAFHYGQDADSPSYRYLVYHPFIQTRNIPQKAFADSSLFTALNSAAASAAASKAVTIAAGGAVAKAILKVVVNAKTHPLRRFKSLLGDPRLYDIPHQMAAWEAKWNEQEQDLRPQIISFKEKLKLDLELATSQLADILRDSAATESQEQDATMTQEVVEATDDLECKSHFIIKTGGHHKAIVTSIEKQLGAQKTDQKTPSDPPPCAGKTREFVERWRKRRAAKGLTPSCSV